LGFRRILLFKTGRTDGQLRKDVGDYEQWFGRAFGDRVELHVHDAVLDPAGARANVRGMDGMVITGSPLSLVAPEPWMHEAAETVRTAGAAGVPTLGVCFGHQLVAFAYGARVRMNPNGWEVGTREVDLTDDGERDPLFAGLPRRVRVNQSHRDEIWELASAMTHIRRLAGSAHTETQAIAVGEHVRGVQFHPEMSGQVVRRIIEHRRPILEEDLVCRGRCRSHLGRWVEDTADTPHGERVLRHFVERFVRAA
jgi:GMP synthase (glutamine-hydrolysing)